MLYTQKSKNSFFYNDIYHIYALEKKKSVGVGIEKRETEMKFQML